MLWSIAGLLLAIGGFASTQRSSADTGPEGMIAFKRFVSKLVDIRDDPGLPSKGTFLLVDDARTVDEAKEVVDWVEQGGRLILMTSQSEIARLLGVDVADQFNPLDDSVTLSTDCLLRETSGVGRLAVSGGDSSMFTTSPSVTGCFHSEQSFFMASVGKGKGRAYLFGGRSMITNEFLRKGDNAILVYRLLAEEESVTFGAPVSAARNSAWDLLPLGARVAIVQTALAVFLFALVRGRRFGRPVLEEPIAVIPASELVRATASLYRQSRQPGFAGGILRQSFLRRMGRRFGTGPEEGERLARIVSSDPTVEPRFAESTLAGPDPTVDEELIKLGQDLEKLETKLLGTWR